MDNFLKELDKRWGPKRVFWVLIVVFVLLVIVSLPFFNFGGRGVSTYGVSGGGIGSGAYSRDENVGAFPQAPGMPSYEKGGGSESVGSPPVNTIPSDRKVTKYGTLDLRVENADSASEEIVAIASHHGGFVEGVYLTEMRDGVKTGTITIRVPSVSFDETVSSVKRLAIRVDGERVQTSDVTVQYIDLEAQLTNLEAEEVQYRKILDRAVKIEDVLAVTARLAEVRARIDSYRMQLQYLSRQVEMATLSVNLTGEPKVDVLDSSWRPLTVAKEALKNLVAEFIAFVNALIAFLFQLPILILKLALIVAVAWIIWKLALWLRHILVR